MMVMIHKHLTLPNKIKILPFLKRFVLPAIAITFLFVVFLFTTNKQSIDMKTPQSGSCLWNSNDATNGQVVVQYKMAQEGTIPGGNSPFRKYIAAYSIKNSEDTQNDSNIRPANVQRLTVREWIECILHDTIDSSNNKSNNHAIRGLYAILKNGTPYGGYFFETPPISYTTYTHEKQQPFEFVIVDSPTLHQVATKHPSYETFQSNCEQNPNDNNTIYNERNMYCCVFPNLSGDAVLVVPKPQPRTNATTKTPTVIVNDTTNNYSHLATFVQNAPYEQFATVWKTIAKTYDTTIMMGESYNNKKIWLSTSGLGVYWLHFRFDEYPKYYSYQPYKAFAST